MPKTLDLVTIRQIHAELRAAPRALISDELAALERALRALLAALEAAAK
jgi:hypothetical protein